MKRQLLIAFVVALVVAAFFVTSRSRATQPPHKVLLCHASGSVKEALVEIDVAAVESHMKHGDCVLEDLSNLVDDALNCSLGECGIEPITQDAEGPAL